MSELLPIASGRRTWAALRELVRPQRGRLAAAIALLVAGTAAGLTAPPLLGRIVDLATAASGTGSGTGTGTGTGGDDAGSGASGTGAFLVTGGLLVLAALVAGALAAAGMAQLTQVAERALARLRERFVAAALRQPLERVERAGSGDLTSRVTNDVTMIAEAARGALPEFARSLLVIGLSLVGMAVLDWRYLLAALVALPVQLHTVRWYTRRAVPLYASQRVAVATQQHQLLGSIDGAPTVRALRLGDDQLRRVASRSQQAVDLLLRGVALQTRFYARLHVAEFAGLAAVLATGFFLVRADASSIGVATAAALYFHGLFGPVNIALATVDDAQAAASGLHRLVGVADLDQSPPPTRPTRAVVPSASLDRLPVRIDRLEFAYRPGRPVLRGVDLSIATGERVAVVGASGAGKTTLAKVIAGVHQPTAGTVAVRGGEPVLVTQEVHVFAGTLAEDLRLVAPQATDRQLRDALAAVDALSWVDQLPAGLATEVGEGGHRLTVAQAQQLAFARVVLADPTVVILDEATAEAGSAGARLLERAVGGVLAGRTALVVAHRLTQAAAADRVVVLDAGRVVEAGSHPELVAAGGVYTTLWRAWTDQRSA